MPFSEIRGRYYPSLREEPQRFWARVATTSTTECWEWTGAKNNQGYGRAGKRGYAHRLAYELTHGAVPSGWLVLHHCDNRPCCNPMHLYLGDYKDNARDCVVRGRHFTPDVPRDDLGRFTKVAA